MGVWGSKNVKGPFQNYHFRTLQYLRIISSPKDGIILYIGAIKVGFGFTPLGCHHFRRLKHVALLARPWLAPLAPRCCGTTFPNRPSGAAAISAGSASFGEAGEKEIVEAKGP